MNKFVMLISVLLLSVINLQVLKAETNNSIKKVTDAEPIVYVRCKRTTEDYDLKGKITVNGVTKTVTRRMKGLDVFDTLPDVKRLLSGFVAPCDLVYRKTSGTERILYNCSNQSTDDAACAAMDPAVSFDGKTIAFSVFRGSLKRHARPVSTTVLDPDANPGNLGYRRDFPNKTLQATEAQLFLIDVATGDVTPLPFVEGEFDSAPAFLADGRLAFTSTRDKNYTTRLFRSTETLRGTRIWSMDLDGKNIDLASHHSTSREEHPYQLKDGRLAYSSWQIFGARPFRYETGHAPGFFDAFHNLFHIYTQSPDGANNFAFYGQHSGDHKPSHFGATHTAAHFLTQTSDERVWFADYYGARNLGLGEIIGVMPEPKSQEGMEPIVEAQVIADMFVPRDVIRFADWVNSEDNVAKVMPEPALMHPKYKDPLAYAGKVGHPAALPNNRLMLVWGKGPCHDYTKGVRIFGWDANQHAFPATTLDTPGCDTGIYRASKIPSEHPSDLEMIVDSPDWHEIMARAVVPYSAIHDSEKPVVIARADTLNSHPELELGTAFGLLGAASLTDRETFPRNGIHFNEIKQFNQQGTDTINYADEDLCGVRILGVMPNRGKYTHREIENLAGERVSIIGEFSVHNKDANGEIVMDGSGHPDTSFLVKMPANMPYLMQSIDCEGRTLNTDMTWQSLRPGEQKTCGGCHVHSRDSRVTFKDTFAALADYDVPHLGEGVVPLLTGKTKGDVTTRDVDGYGFSIDFTRDIMPIFQKRCASCHSGNNAAGGLDLATLGSHGFPKRGNDPQTPSSWFCLVKDFKQQCVSENKKMETGAGSSGSARNYMFRRPQVSRYVRAFNSLGSLLYWKAAGERTDNNTDDTFTDASNTKDFDIDFGLAHKHQITPEELGLISRWIDIGSSGGPDELRDTQKPSLSMVGVVSGGNISELKIGTVDLGSGIDSDTLKLCIIEDNTKCENNLAQGALSHGVASINVSLNDVTTEVYVEVSDKAGNTTKIRRTVGFMLEKPSPPPPSHVIIPDVSSSIKAVAITTLEALGLSVTTTLESSNTVPLGGIIKTSPRFGSPVAEGSTINLVISTGAAVAGECNLTQQTETQTISGIKVLHHDGQSFVSWKDRAEGEAGAAYRYRVYRSASPIKTDADLIGAELIAEKILNHSGQLYGRVFSPSNRVDPTRPMAITQEGGDPLPVWSGLWVANTRTSACAFYAILATDDENNPVESIVYGANTTTEAVSEQIAIHIPMKLYDSNERIVNGSLAPWIKWTRIRGTPNLPLMIELHASSRRGGVASDYGDYYLYYGKRSMGYQEGLPGVFSVQSEYRKHNFFESLLMRSRDTIIHPKAEKSEGIETWWFGYVAEPIYSGERLAYPFTENRLNWMIPWVSDNYQVDLNRIYVKGGSMGAWGVMSYAFRRPDLFAALYPNRPRMRQTSMASVVPGPVAGVLTPSGETWEQHHDAIHFVKNHPSDLSFLGWSIGRNDGFATWTEQIEMVKALTEQRQGFAFAWNNGGHAGYEVSAPTRTIEHWYPAEKFALNKSFPAFSNSSIDDDLGNGDPTNGDLVGGINLGFDWTIHTDEANKWEISISNELATKEMTVDITPRRTQRFDPPPGTTVSYTDSFGRSGNVAVDVAGRVTILGLSIRPNVNTKLTLQVQ